MALVWAAGPLPAGAQDATTTITPASPPPTERLDNDKAVLDRVEGALSSGHLNDAGLQQQRALIAPVQIDTQAVVTELQPKLDAAKARLAQLGTKPDAKPGTSPEAADITAERDNQQKLFNDLDATLKRAKVLQVQADQLDATVSAQRRSLFTRSVLAQSSSILDPRLWKAVVSELPSDIRSLVFLATDWWSNVAVKLPGWQAAVLVGTIIVVILLYEPAQRVSRRVAGRDIAAKPPGRLRKVIAALWTAVLTVLVPAAALCLLGFVFSAFEVVTPRLQPLATTIIRAVMIYAVVVGLARGFLAPRRAAWRIPTISDLGASSLYRVTLAVGALVGTTFIADALGDTIGVGLPTTVATRGLLTAFAVVAMALTLKRLGVDSDELAKAAAARKAQGRDWTGALRLLFWILIIIVTGALLLGFVSFAAFLVTQIEAISGICIALALLLGLVDDGVGVLLDPARGLGRILVHTMGVRRGSLQIVAIVLTGVLRVILICNALLLALARWRIDSGDLLSTLQAAFSGFSIGDLTISPLSIVLSILLFLIAIAVTHGVQRWLEGTLLPHTRLDSGLQNSIKTSLGYIGFLIACLLSLSQLGVSFERLAIVAGALSVGIGFGLQSIVNNFVSGLIILWERAIRVGDWIVVGDEQGYVRRINVRSTEIETFDRCTVIVPNQNLVSGVVKNWLRNGHVGRIRLPFTLGYSADPDQIRDILIEEAKANEHVLSIPSPQVLLSSLGGDSMKVELVCYLEEVETMQRTTSDLLFSIHKRLRGIGLLQPAGPPTVASPVLDKLDAWLTAKVTETAAAANGDARR